jgi:hypothetical protein
LIIIFFTARKLIVLDVLLKGGKSNQSLYKLPFSGFAKGKPEFFSSDATFDFMGAH